MAAWLDGCSFVAVSAGTADFVVSIAALGCQTPSLAGAVNGRPYKYHAQSADRTQWEDGEGIYNSGTTTIPRTTVLYNSSGTGTGVGQSGAGTKISFTAAPTVSIVALKEDLISVEEANGFSTTQKAQINTNIGSAALAASNYFTVAYGHSIGSASPGAGWGLYHAGTINSTGGWAINWQTDAVLTATANGDGLQAMRITAVAVKGAFTGVTSYGLYIAGGSSTPYDWGIRVNDTSPVYFGGTMRTVGVATFDVAPVFTVPLGSANALNAVSYGGAQSLTDAQRAQSRANVGAALNDDANVSFAVSAASGALTIALKDAAGNDPTSSTPVSLLFRSSTLTTGTQSVLEVTAATSVVVPSTSTLGTTSAVACRLWIIGWNDGGTFRLGVFNASNPTTIFPLVEAGVSSSLQVVAAGNAAGQHYTAGAAVTSKAFRILGYVDWNSSGVVTAGTWTTTNLNSIQTFGPGIKKPGDIVQEVTFSSATGTAGTSSTFTASALTKATTPTSAANLIQASAGLQILPSGSGTVGIVQLGRTSNSNMFGNFGAAYSSAGATCSSCSLLGMDLPNSASSTTYTVYQKSSDNTTVVSTLPNSYSGFMKLAEIMS
jgi:hypothetical protein